MITLGDYNTLRIRKRTDFGLYLDGGEEAGNILLPNRYVTPQMHIGDELEVFLYLDQEERLIATTERPLAKVGEFAWLQVAWTNEYGAFLNWGLMKDLFCPFREQKQRMERGKHYIVYVKQDDDTHRLMATAKVEKYLAPLYPPTGGRTVPFGGNEGMGGILPPPFGGNEGMGVILPPPFGGNEGGFTAMLSTCSSGRRPTWASRPSWTTATRASSTQTRYSSRSPRATA